jgi:NADPH-dependent 2,4-dienoyl-CoA reductase/sulfur reductase-like enzyme
MGYRRRTSWSDRAHESARLGHQVTLFEMDARTGGQVLLAARAPFKEAYERWIKGLPPKRKGLVSSFS